MNLPERMKMYESVSQTQLMQNLPVIMRIDGRSFHTFTKGMKKPVERSLRKCMELTAIKLCEDIDGAKIAHVFSDEISILLTDYTTFETQPWFGYRVQKLVSVGASIATAEFNHMKNYFRFDIRGFGVKGNELPLAHFDCRVFSMPHHEVGNYFLWRIQDARRNSISSYAQTRFSHSDLQGKDVDTMVGMLRDSGLDWFDLPSVDKTGYVIYPKDGRLILDGTYSDTGIVLDIIREQVYSGQAFS